MRVVMITAAALLLWRAYAIEGDPEGSVVLGAIATLCVIVSLMDVELPSGTWNVSERWRRELAAREELEAEERRL